MRDMSSVTRLQVALLVVWYLTSEVTVASQ
jgi:hypothetical protein